MKTDIDDLIAENLDPYERERTDDVDYFNDLGKRNAGALRAQQAEIARLTKLEQECWTSPEQWMAWCDIRMLERAERTEAERDAAIKDAERYRWLREMAQLGSEDDYSHPYIKMWFPDVPKNLNGYLWRAPTGPKLDAAIDAAMKAKP